jgi:hypothetical protein
MAVIESVLVKCVNLEEEKIEESIKTEVNLKVEKKNLQEISKANEPQDLNLKVKEENLEVILKSQEAQILELMNQGIDIILTSPNDETEILFKKHRAFLLYLEIFDSELNMMPAKSIIAAMKVYCVSHAEEDMKRIVVMRKSMKVLNVKTMIAAFGEVTIPSSCLCSV